jgi:lipopolysaccharide/colanic/teichoic acid biosynthesis glycosyltransferase
MGKRAFDLAAAVLALVLLSPVLALVAAAVRLDLGPPVLFRQRRPGLRGEPFTILKFRTMRAPLAPGRDLDDEEERLTRLGRLLRSTSLDELPELVNVVRGDMSLVGPRPLLMEYLERYSPEQARRHLVRPGITGWAQVHGRNALTWEEKFGLDVYYVDHRSAWLDVRILALTVVRVLSREGISADGETTAPMFLGSPPEPPRAA